MRAVRHTGHRDFSDVAEELRGMLDLMRWVNEGETPQGDDLTGDDLRGVGTAFTSPFDRETRWLRPWAACRGTARRLAPP